METNLLDTFFILFTRKIKEGRDIYLITENWVILIIKIEQHFIIYEIVYNPIYDDI